MRFYTEESSVLLATIHAERLNAKSVNEGPIFKRFLPTHAGIKTFHMSLRANCYVSLTLE